MMEDFKYLPKSITENLVTRELSDELLIYNLKTDKAYNLNITSASVWQKCDGSKTVNQIAAELEKEFKQPVSEELIRLALNDLRRENLIDFHERETKSLPPLNRREAAKRIALSSMITLPIITSLIAPRAANAASGGGVGATCQNDKDCRATYWSCNGGVTGTGNSINCNNGQGCPGAGKCCYCSANTKPPGATGCVCVN